MTGRPAWPLHPPPGRFEPLRTYVERLAELCEASYSAFCASALRIPPDDREALSLADPCDEVLERLSAGTGVPAEELREMRLCATWARLHAEIEAQTATPDGRRAFESMFPDLRHKWAHP